MTLHETTIKDTISIIIGIGLIGYLLVYTFLFNRDEFKIIGLIVLVSFSISIPFSHFYVKYLEKKENKESFDYKYGDD